MEYKKTTTATITKRSALCETPLPIDDSLIQALCNKHCHDMISRVPSAAYWALAENRKMCYSDNICGYQQRAFDVYWCLRALFDHGAICLSVGAGAIGAPNCLTTDKFNGSPPPEKNNRYGAPGAEYGYSSLYLDADEPWPFFDRQFGAVMMNHSFEHFNKQEYALREAIRVTKSGGYVCIIMPDMTFMARGSIDATHTTEWTADDFYYFLVDTVIKGNLCTLEEHNTFDNAFSFNTVLKVN